MADNDRAAKLTGKWNDAIKFLKSHPTFFKIAIVFGVPFILSLPFPPPPFNVQHFKTELRNSGPEPVQQEKFQFLTNIDATGASMLSRILSIKTDSMPGYICITNTSEIYSPDNERLNKDDLLEDVAGGAIGVPLISDATTSKIYVPFASTTCVYPQPSQGFAELDNRIETRGFLPFGKAELKTIDGQGVIAMKNYGSVTTVFKMEGERGYNWKWSVFWSNYSLFLIGWVILLSSIIQVYYWVRPKVR